MMRRLNFTAKWIPAILLVLAAPLITSGQDLEQVLKKPAGFAGSIRLGAEFYDVNGIDPRRSPSSWILSGNVSFTLAGIAFPVSFSFRDQQFSYGASFNQFGVSPYYKWIRVHAGWRSMTFSPYTLNGRTFLGGGVELTPGEFRLSGFYGTFRNLLAVQDTIVYGSSLLPVYDRKAFGAKIGYGSDRTYVDFIVVKAWDDTGTPGANDDLPNPFYFAYAPKENLILGSSFKIRLFKKLDLYGNAGASAITENTALASQYPPEFNYLEDIYALNASSRFALAGDAGIRLRIKRSTIGVQYKRIEPFYSTLTTDFFYNDIENITFQASTSSRKGKVRFSGNLGFEHNNLYEHQSVTSSRVIGSANMTLMPVQPLVLSLRYSNYTQNSESGLLVINDTLRLATTSANYGLMANYTLGEERKNSLSGYLGRTTITDQSPVTRLGNLTTDIATVTYTYTLPGTALRLSPTLNYARYQYPDSRQERFGGGINISTPLAEKKILLTAGTNYSRNDIDAFKNGYVLSSRLGVTYSPYATGAINVSLQHISNQTILQDAFSEVRGRIQYTQKLGF